MTLLLSNNETIEKILRVAEELSNDEQKMFLAQMNAAVLLKENKTIVKKGMPKLSMAQIDKLKHKSRK